MSSTTLILMAGVVGMLLGIMYFGSLWATVRTLPTTTHPLTMLLLSFAIRSSLVLGGFLVIWGGYPSRLAACLVGFLLARSICMRVVGRETGSKLPQNEAQELLDQHVTDTRQLGA